MSRTVFYGLPTSVDSVDKLPKHAFDGHLCYVKADQDGGLYVFNGTQYDAISVSSDGGSDTPATSVDLPKYENTSAFPTAVEGGLIYVQSTKAVYVSDGTNWNKMRNEVGLIAPSDAPANPVAGQMYWLAGTGLQIYDGTAWKTVTIS